MLTSTDLTLLVEDNPQIERFYALNLHTWLGLDTICSKSFADATKVIAENPDIKLIIVRHSLKKEPTAALLLDHLKKEASHPPVVIIGAGAEVAGSVTQITNSLDIKAMIQATAKALNITAKEMTQKVVPDFFPIPIAFFRIIQRPVCIVYHKTKTYEVLVDKDQPFDFQKLDALAKEGITHLYVDKLSRLEFVNYVTSELISLLEAKNLNQDEQLTAQDKSVELLSKKLLTVGITEETITLAKKSMDGIKKNVKAYPKLAHLVSKMLQNKSSYLFKHSQILSYVGLHIVRNIDWGNPEQEDKMIFLAFFHDIALTNDEEAMIKSTAELKRSALTVPQRQLVEKHAQIASEIVSKFPHSPMGADQLIRQHHGTLNGVGFSDHYGNNVSPISVVFLIAEEYTRIILKNEGQHLEKSDLIRELKGEFSTNRFMKVIDMLETLPLN